MSTFDLQAFNRAFEEAAHLQGLERELLCMAAEEGVYLWRRPLKESVAARACLSAGIHGDEGCGPEALLRYLRIHQLPTGIDWVITPTLNPKGLCSGTRENLEGVDLNRDFLKRRCPETRAFIDWWSRNSPCDYHISLHEDWEAEGFYLYVINTGLRQSKARQILDRVSQVAPLQQNPVDDHVLDAPGLIVHPPEPHEPEGWPEAIWVTRTFPAISYTLEAPGRLSPEQRVIGLCAGLAATVEVIAGPEE